MYPRPASFEPAHTRNQAKVVPNQIPPVLPSIRVFSPERLEGGRKPLPPSMLPVDLVVSAARLAGRRTLVTRRGAATAVTNPDGAGLRGTSVN